METSRRVIGQGASLFLAHWIFFTLGVAESSLPPALPTLAERMAVPLGNLGILFTARALGFLTMFIAASWLTSRLGRNRLMVISLGIIALVLPLQPMMPSLPVGILLLILFGIGGGALNVSASVLVGDLSPKERTLALNRLYLFLSIGVLTGPILVGITLTQWKMIAPPFWVTAAMLLAALLALAWAPLPSSKPPPPLRFGSASPLKEGRFWILAAFLFLFVGTYLGFAGWIFSYIQTSLGGEVALASAAASSFGVAEVIGRLARLGPFRRLPDGPLVVGSCVSGLLAALLLCWTRSPLLAVAASLWLGLSFSILYPTILGLGQQLQPEEAVTIVSILGIVSAVGAMLLPWFQGQFMIGEARMWPVVLLGSTTLLVGLAVAVSRSIPPPAYASSETGQPQSVSG